MNNLFRLLACVQLRNFLTNKTTSEHFGRKRKGAGDSSSEITSEHLST